MNLENVTRLSSKCQTLFYVVAATLSDMNDDVLPTRIHGRAIVEMLEYHGVSIQYRKVDPDVRRYPAFFALLPHGRVLGGN